MPRRRRHRRLPERRRRSSRVVSQACMCQRSAFSASYVVPIPSLYLHLVLPGSIFSTWTVSPACSLADQTRPDPTSPYPLPSNACHPSRPSMEMQPDQLAADDEATAPGRTSPSPSPTPTLTRRRKVSGPQDCCRTCRLRKVGRLSAWSPALLLLYIFKDAIRGPVVGQLGPMSTCSG